MAGTLLAKEVQRTLAFPAVSPTYEKQFLVKPAEGLVLCDASKFSYLLYNSKTAGRRTLHCATFGGAAQASVVYAPHQHTVNFYEVLGVSQGVSDAELKDAYRTMVKQFHPDHAPPEKAEEYQKKFMEVHRAYNMLKDPKRRSIHDFEIKNSPNARNWRYEEKTGQWRGRNWETDQCWTS